MFAVNILNIAFRSYVKLITLISAALGLIIGIIAFLGSLIGLPVQTTFLLVRLEGIDAGVFSIVLGPIVFSLLGMLLGIVTYPPFKQILKVIRGIKIEGDFRSRE